MRQAQTGRHGGEGARRKACKERKTEPVQRESGQGSKKGIETHRDSDNQERGKGNHKKINASIMHGNRTNYYEG